MKQVPLKKSKNDTQNLLPAKEVAGLVGYTSDYVTRLAREGKIDAVNEGRQWLVDPDSVKLFSLQAAAEKRERALQLREKRIQERALTVRATEAAKIDEEVVTSAQGAVLQTVVLTTCLFLVVHVFWFAAESRLNLDALVGGVSVVAERISQSVIEPIPDLFSQVAAYAFVAFQKDDTEIGDAVMFESDAVSSNDPDFQGVVIMEDGGAHQEYLDTIRSSFSDDVEVEFDAEDSGVIRPTFTERDGESYRFLLVPVNTSGE